MPQPNIPPPPPQPPLPPAGARPAPLNNAALLAELAGPPKLRKVASSDKSDKSAARVGEVHEEKTQKPTYEETPHSQRVAETERSQASVWSEKDDGEKEAQRLKEFREQLDAKLQGFGKGG